jgi:RimJ/RimL family protein N-acetyltransferase
MDKSKTNEIVGDCALKHEHDARQATIGITLARSYHGKGFATEAGSCLLDYVFVQMHLHRVVADTDPQNTPAWTLLERLGMRREGHLKQSPLKSTLL